MIKAHIIIIILNEDFICMFLDQENCTKEVTDDVDTGSIKANFKGKQVSKRNKMVPFMSNVFNALYYLNYLKLTELRKGNNLWQ